MKIEGVAIDCGWLMELDKADFVIIRNFYNFVDRMRSSNVSLLIDQEGNISREYSNYMNDMIHGRPALVELMQSTTFHSGKPKNLCMNALKLDCFDPSDIPYIGVAQNGSGIYLTHEIKHLEPSRCAKILSACSVRIVSTADLPFLLT